MSWNPVHYPPELPRSQQFEVALIGTGPADLIATQRADLATFLADGPVSGASLRLQIRARHDLTGTLVHPASHARLLAIDGPTAEVEFTPTPGKGGRLLLETPGQRLIALRLDPAPAPPPASGRVRHFPPGVHDIGVLPICAGESLWAEPGAVLRGVLRPTGEGITIGGGGVLDANRSNQANTRGRALIADRCDGLHLGAGGGLTVINAPTWQIVLGASDHVRVHDLTLLGLGLATDGVDVVGCQHVDIADCFIVNADDCFVVKAFGSLDSGYDHFRRDVRDVTFRSSLIGNFLGGSAVEIGHEVAVDHVQDITFRDIDIMFVHNHGAALGLHHADHALIENVRFQQIRVHHCYDKFIDFRIIRSRYSKQSRRGHVRGVLVEDIDWHTTPYNAGYTTSQIGGCDADHLIDDVRFRRIRLDGKAIQSLDELDLFTRHVRNLRLEP